MTSLERVDESRMLALGDSYTIGESVMPEERWIDQLIVLLGDRGVRITEPVIVARTGWTTDELSFGIDAAHPRPPFELVTLLVGVNDQYRGRTVEDFRGRFPALLARAVAFAGGRGDHVIVLSIPDWGVTPFAKGRGRRQISAAIDAFNDVVRTESRRAGANFVDVTQISRTAANDPRLVTTDGLHPSGLMYTAWAQRVLPVALRALGRG